MSESLKDQLIRAGLAPARPRQKKKPPVRETETDLATAYRLRKNEAQQRKQNKQRKKLADEKRRRKINKELRALVEAHSVRDPQADIARNFMFKGRIRKVLVNKNQLAAVNSGELVIVYLAGSYHLVPAENAGIVQQIAPDHLPDLRTETSPEDEEFPVPDDLVW
jgi:uncharacterized protein YaiL (DUF2058 family)